MTFGQSVHICFIKYFTISGRAARSEYWWWYLFYYMIVYGLAYLNDPAIVYDWDTWSSSGWGFSPLELFWNIIVLIPSVTVSIRRLHDVGRSGWWILLFFTIIGIVVLFFWAIRPSQSDNKYGKNPSVDTNV